MNGSSGVSYEGLSPIQTLSLWACCSDLFKTFDLEDLDLEYFFTLESESRLTMNLEVLGFDLVKILDLDSFGSDGLIFSSFSASRFD